MKQFAIITLAIFFAGQLSGQSCSDVFFSEYVEGSSQNKAVEIYNPTDQTISLNGYVLRRYKNGINTYDTELSLQGQSIAPYDVLVITNGQTVENDYGVVDPTLYNLGDMAGTGQHSTSPMYFNGNDALTIEKTVDGQNYTIVDIFARVGSPDPVNGWTDTTGITVNYNDNGTPTTYTIENYIVGPLFWYSWTRDHTLIRKPAVTGGVTTNPTAFMVHVEWDSIPKDTWDSLGAHTCDCQQPTSVYQAPAQEDAVEILGNPVSNGILQIESSKTVRMVRIYDLAGKVVYLQQEQLEGNISLSLPELKGVNFVQIIFTDNTALTKAILFK